MSSEKYIPLIVEHLKKASPHKIILFGSYAYGTPNDDSDLDLIVITMDNYMPSTNKEKMELHHQYNPLVKEFREFIPIDLLVYTKAMFQKLQKTGSMFIREIDQKGKVLYEAIN